MKKFAVTGLLSLALIPSAFADRVFVDGLDSVVLRETDCPSQLVEIARAKGVSPDVPLKLATATVDGVEFKGCWMQINQQAIGVIYEDGDIGLIPEQALRKMKDA